MGFPEVVGPVAAHDAWEVVDSHGRLGLLMLMVLVRLGFLHKYNEGGIRVLKYWVLGPPGTACSAGDWSGHGAVVRACFPTDDKDERLLFFSERPAPSTSKVPRK